MATVLPRALLALRYEKAAQEYLSSLPLEHFMEATAQARQREITLESLALVKARRSDLHVFNELLVQYPRSRQRRLGQVVPDNMIVLTDQPVKATTSYNLPLESARPFWVLEYVSKTNHRKVYEDNFAKYERELKVPYYLVFHPENQELTLYRHNGKKYVTVKPNRQGRYPIRPLEMEVAIREGWVRFWYRGELLPLPDELQKELDQTKTHLEQAAQRAEAAAQRGEEAVRRAEEAIRQAEEATRRASDIQARLEQAERELAQLRGAGQPPPTRNRHGRQPETNG